MTSSTTEWCPYRTIEVTEVPLQTFNSPWTHIYESLLECLDIKQRTIDRVVTHKDGQILLKYQVAVVTPSDLGFQCNLYKGEA